MFIGSVGANIGSLVEILRLNPRGIHKLGRLTLRNNSEGTSLFSRGPSGTRLAIRSYSLPNRARRI